MWQVAAVAASAEFSKRGRGIADKERELRLAAVSITRAGRLGDPEQSTVGALAGRKVIIYGSADKVARDLKRARVFRRRLRAARISIVAVVDDARPPLDALSEHGFTLSPSPNGFCYPPEPAAVSRSFDWLWCARPNGAAQDFFRDVLGPDQASEGAYVSLMATGRLRGSGNGSPNISVLLSTFPRNQRTGASAFIPFLPGSAEEEGAGEADGDEAAIEAKGEAAAVLQLQQCFYEALGAGDEPKLRATFAPDRAEAMTRFESKGARVDGWDVVLREDRRPLGLSTSDSDCIVSADGQEAFATTVEQVANSSTLLATQRMKRGDDGRWLIATHETTPWGVDVVAKVVLACDSRGCCALPAKARASDRAGEAPI